jgi:hypothetical protein
MKYFECGVRYTKAGTNKLSTELYLVDAYSFADAEARVITEVNPYSDSAIDVLSIKRTNYANIVPGDDAEKWFKAKINFITINERTGKEKKTACYYLVGANDIDAAHSRMLDYMKGTVADYEIATLDETKIQEVYQYDSGGVSQSRDE